MFRPAPRKALSNANRPRGLGLTWPVVLGLLMDRMDAPGWLWGMFLAVAGMWLLANLVDLFTAKDVEL